VAVTRAKEQIVRIADILETKGRTVYSIRLWKTVAEVVTELGRARVGALLVLDAHDTIAGIVSERDIVRALGRHGAATLSLEVTEVMTRQVRTCTPEMAVAEAMAVMTAGRHRHLPVLDHGQVVGIVSIGDLVKHRVREMELETGVLRDKVIARS
jgi:CBS domain-containing protein